MSTPPKSAGDMLYLHFPCFDGLISSVIVTEFLESRGWRFEHVEPLTYEIRSKWLDMQLPVRSAVVDFLFHPDAKFWADHHLTTFASERARKQFDSEPSPHDHGQGWFYDSSKGSCAMLLWEKVSSFLNRERERLEEMVSWADKIDSAGYDNVHEAILGDEPALQINSSLILGNTEEYCNFLWNALRTTTLRELARKPEVNSRFREVRERMLRGLEVFAHASRLDSGEVIVFDVEIPSDTIVSRYSPFYFYPEARYSIGLTRDERGARITAMRNPWRSFPSVPLGPLFEHYGGGGHTRVAAVALGHLDRNEASRILLDLAESIRKEDIASTSRI